MPVQIIKNDFPRVALALHVDGPTAEARAAKRMAEDARAHAPVLTGTLRASIVARRSEVFAQAPYSGYVEYGTRYMDAEPYFFEAADREMPRFVAELFVILRRFA